MKRALLILGGVVVLVIVVVGGLVAASFSGKQPVVDGFEVDGIRIIEAGIAAIGVVPVGPGQVALIDAGMDTEGTALLAELSRRQLGTDAVVAILLTHGHGDHVGALRVFPNAQVMALQQEVALIEGREGPKSPLLRLMPVSPTGITVDRALSDGEQLTIGTASVRVFAVPGHTAGSAAYLVNSVLFVGDAADSGSDGRLMGAPWIFSDSQSQSNASLVRLFRRLEEEKVAVTAIAPSHSAVMTDGLAQLQAFVLTGSN